MVFLQLARISEAAFRISAYLLSGTPIDAALAGGLTQLIFAPTTGKDGNHLFVGDTRSCPLMWQML